MVNGLTGLSRHRLLIIYRIFVLGLQNFIRNAWLTIIALAMMTMAITFALSGIILNVTSTNVISDLSHNLKISIYLQPDVSSEDAQPLISTLNSHQDVDNVAYISATEAREEFSTTYNDEYLSEAIELVGDDAFPASLEVSAKDLNKVGAIEEIAYDSQYSTLVESISLGKLDAQTTIDRAISIQNFLIRLSVILVLTFGLISIAVIFNTIRMAIFSRSEEIQIMRFIGAPTHFIYGPFLVEAGLFGILAGSLSVSLIYISLNIFSERILAVEELIESYVYFTDSILIIILMVMGSILGGIIVGISACLWALKRYLKL